MVNFIWRQLKPTHFDYRVLSSSGPFCIVKEKLKSCVFIPIFVTINQPTLGFSTKCNKPCNTCPRMDISNTITSLDRISYKIQCKFTCQSRCIVYVITCTICGNMYEKQHKYSTRDSELMKVSSEVIVKITLLNTST